MKKLLSICLAICIMMGAIVLPAFASSNTIDESTTSVKVYDSIEEAKSDIEAREIDVIVGTSEFVIIRSGNTDQYDIYYRFNCGYMISQVAWNKVEMKSDPLGQVYSYVGYTMRNTGGAISNYVYIGRFTGPRNMDRFYINENGMKVYRMSPDPMWLSVSFLTGYYNVK